MDRARDAHPMALRFLHATTAGVGASGAAIRGRREHGGVELLDRDGQEMREQPHALRIPQTATRGRRTRRSSGRLHVAAPDATAASSDRAASSPSRSASASTAAATRCIPRRGASARARATQARRRPRGLLARRAPAARPHGRAASARPMPARPCARSVEVPRSSMGERLVIAPERWRRAARRRARGAEAGRARAG